MYIPDDLLAPYGPIWPVDEDRDLYDWDQRFGAEPENIAEYIAECIAEEWRLVAQQNSLTLNLSVDRLGVIFAPKIIGGVTNAITGSRLIRPAWERV